MIRFHRLGEERGLLALLAPEAAVRRGRRDLGNKSHEQVARRARLLEDQRSAGT